MQPATSGVHVKLAAFAAATCALSHGPAGMLNAPLSRIAWPQPPITPVAAAEPALPFPAIRPNTPAGTSGFGGGFGGGADLAIGGTVIVLVRVFFTPIGTPTEGRGGGCSRR